MNILATIVLIFLIAIVAQGQIQRNKPGPTTLQTSAQAQVEVIADQVDILADIHSQGQTAVSAAEKNQQDYEHIVEIIRDNLGKDALIDTTYLNVDMGYSTSNSPQSVVRQVRIHLNTTEMAMISRAMDSIAQAGLQGRVEYVWSGIEKAKLQMLSKATTEAKERATAMATASGMKVLRIVSIDDSPPNMPNMLNGGYSKGGMRTPQSATVTGSPAMSPLALGGPTNQSNPFSGTRGPTTTVVDSTGRVTTYSGSPQILIVFAAVTVVVEVGK